MDYRRLHGWDVSPHEAIRIQQELRTRLIAQDDDQAAFRTVAAMDVSYDKRSPWLFATIVVMRFPGFQVVETAGVRAQARFPYIPGLLSFRESPAGLEAWESLRTRPDCLICDGHGMPAAAPAAVASGMPSSVSWSVSAMAAKPTRFASRTTSAGDRDPSDAVECVCRSTNGPSTVPPVCAPLTRRNWLRAKCRSVARSRAAEADPRR